MSWTLQRAALGCLASMALTVQASPVHAQQQPVGQPPAAAPAAPPTPEAQPPSAMPPLALPELPVTEPAPAPIVTMPPLTTVQVDRYWYLLMLADVSWLWASIRLDQENLAFVTYPTLAPAVHLFMGNGRGALTSLAVRVGAEAIAYGYSAVADAEDREVLVTGGVLLGVAAVFDWFYLGRRFKTVPLPAHGRESSSYTWTWTPSVLAGAHAWQLGVAGAF
ncbi:MAG TPA: hypothetical protein VNM90_00660 [Haliangium sp.]|nr:hypothetical protein [Haliangium sp.]